MQATTKKTIILDKVSAFFSKRIVYHSILWALYIVIFTIIEGKSSQNYVFAFSEELIKVIFYAAGVYFNFKYLIPNYLTQKKFLTYCALLILAVVIITPLQVFALYLHRVSYPVAQNYLVSNMTWFFIVAFLFISMTTIMKIVAEWVRHQREKKELETQNMQSELRFLKSQINPHFLFNTLNNLYALTLKKDDKAPDIVLKLSEMMRYMLYECNEKWVLLSREVHHLKNYIDLESLRQGKHTEIEFEVNGLISNQKIAPLLFIPFLENSFKHGISNTLSKGFVKIELNISDNDVHLYISNSKPSIPNQFHKRSGGIGLVNVRRRLNILYPEQYDLEVDDSPNSYSVNLYLQLEV